MSTVDRKIADKIVAGEFNDEVRLIVKYTNAWGGEAYGTVFHGRPNQYTPSSYVIDPEVFWINPKDQGPAAGD